MKKKLFIGFISVLVVIAFPISSFAQVEKTTEEQLRFQEEEELESKTERLKYYRERYEETFNETFETVWLAIKKSLEDISCMISYEKYQQDTNGLFRGTIKSDFCVFTMGKDTTFKVLKKFSYEMPLIRGGIWINGRIQYTFRVIENDDGSIFLSFKGQLSGFEEFVTHQVHFWKSNGYLETKMLQRIKENISFVKQK
ncbi:MAG: hypothetical protein ACUVQ1_01500 [Candidatus Kapaibacteriales bacterium]